MSRPLVAAVVLFVALITLIGGTGTSSADSPVGKIYRVYQGTILRSNLDGSAEEEVVPAGYSPGDMAVDKTGGFLYWINAPAGKIQRADTDGGNIVDIVTGISGLYRLTLDGAGKLYWNTRTGTSFTAEGTSWRADVDGSNIESVYTFPALRTIAVDPVGGYIYSALLNTIIRSPIDGSSTNLFEDAWADAFGYAVNDLALDHSTGEIYYAARTPLVGITVKPSGTVGNAGGWSHGIKETGFHHIALDLEHGHVYWTDSTQQRLFRANLDGTDVFSVLDAGCCSGGIALAPCPAGESCPPPPAAPTATPTAPTPDPVGGVSAESNLRPLPLEAGSPGGGDFGVLAGVIAGVVASAAVLGGAAWYSRRRWIRS